MRKRVGIFQRRVVLVPLGLLIQFALLALLWDFLGDRAPWLEYVVFGLRCIAVIYLFSAPSNPSYKLAWITLILVFPAMGLFLFLFLGKHPFSGRRKNQIARMSDFLRECSTDDEAACRLFAAERPSALAQVNYLRNTAFAPLYADTDVRYFSSGEPCWKAMLEDLERAEKFIFLEFFIVKDGVMWSSILEVLRRKAASGVEVRMLYDDFGCLDHVPADYFRELENMGIRAKKVNPIVPVFSWQLNNRDHRKLLIVDGCVGYTGSSNLADEYIGKIIRFGVWKDANIRLAGSAVQSMTALFLSMWDGMDAAHEDVSRFFAPCPPQAEHGYVQAFGDSPLDNETVGANTYLNMISHARNFLYVMTPYLILDEKLTNALVTAAKSGVDVRIITPGIPDKRIVYSVTRNNYGPLVDAGVRIYEYTPGFLHSKVCCADGKIAQVGTVNMDYRSLYLHFENSVMLYGTDCISDIMQDFEETFAVSREVTRRKVKATPLPVQIYRSILNLFAPLM